MKILIPMAGAGSSFQRAGYTFPKPLISVGDRPMIQVVVENLPQASEYIFLCQKEHIEKYNLTSLLRGIVDRESLVNIFPVAGVTEGAACTALLARELLTKDDEDLLIANSDQFMEYSKENFWLLRNLISQGMNLVPRHMIRGLIFTFYATHPKWSFVQLDENGTCINHVAEKNPVSNVATTGVYYFARGKDFVYAADEMIRQNKHVKGEFYIAPCFNELIDRGEWIAPFFVNKMVGLGTPEDLKLALDYFNVLRP